MKNLFKSFVVLLAVMAAVPSFAQKANNTLTEKEKKQGWILLFNGKDFTGWRQCNNTGMAPNWVIEDEAMKVFTAPGKKIGRCAFERTCQPMKLLRLLSLFQPSHPGRATGQSSTSLGRPPAPPQAATQFPIYRRPEGGRHQNSGKPRLPGPGFKLYRKANFTAKSRAMR